MGRSMRRYRNALLATMILIASGWGLMLYKDYEDDMADEELFRILKMEGKAGPDLTVDKLRSARINRITSNNDDLGVMSYVLENWILLMFAIFAGCFAIAFFVGQRSRMRDAILHRALNAEE